MTDITPETSSNPTVPAPPTLEQGLALLGIPAEVIQQITTGEPIAIEDLPVPVVADAPMPKLYKVLVKGVFEGNAWPLPAEDGSLPRWVRFNPSQDGVPGVKLCYDPFEHYSPGAQVYEVEYDKNHPVKLLEDGILATRIRVVREANWKDFNVYLDGTHFLSAGVAKSYNANVRVTGDATLYAEGRGLVIAEENATVYAGGTIDVRVKGKVKLFARGSCTFIASEHAKVFCSQDAFGEAGEDCLVMAYNGNVTIKERVRCYSVHGEVVAKQDTQVHLIAQSTVEAENSVLIHQGPFCLDSDITIVPAESTP